MSALICIFSPTASRAFPSYCRYGRQIEDIEVRNSLRCIVDDAEWARSIYDRVRAHIPAVWRCRRGFEWEPVSVNERLRFLRYEPGQYFRPHYDVRGVCVCESRRAIAAYQCRANLFSCIRILIWMFCHA